ncbi:MAG: MFS transporter [Myxococcota bacterium]
MLVADITNAARSEPQTERMRPLLVVAFALSGAAGLILEVAWFRRLGVGSSMVAGAAGIVTAAYMGGLALGNWIGGRLSSRSQHRLWIYGAMEAVVALSAVLVPLGLSPMSPESHFLSWVAAGTLLMIPTTAMGMGLPLLASTMERSASGKTTAFLYAVNTAGAALGVSWAGFWGLPMLGAEIVDLVAACIQLGVVALICAAAWRAPRCITREDQRPETRLDSERQGIKPSAVVLLSAGSASAAAMLVQVSWTELAVQRLGQLGEGFSITVLAFIAGLSVGGFVAMRLLQRMGDLHRTLAAMLGVTAMCLVLAWFTTPNEGAPLVMIIPLLPMTVAGGTLFPLFVGLSSSGGASIGVSVGTTGAASTVGAIMGSLGAIGLLPALGAPTSLVACVVVYATLAAVFALRAARRRAC